jgi:hypothetical protein
VDGTDFPDDVTLDELLARLDSLTPRTAAPPQWRDETNTAPRAQPTTIEGDGADSVGGKIHIEEAYGEVDWFDTPSALLGCTRAAAESKEGGIVGMSPKVHAVRCALEIGRQWPTGRVEVNIGNHATGAVSVWQVRCAFSDRNVHSKIAIGVHALCSA